MEAMMFKPTLLLLAMIAWTALPSTRTEAATWTVEKDGSGDFTVIQDAVNAAASGDSIRIGPGRYEEVHTFQLPGGLVEAHARIEQSELTIVGAGADVTIIGPPTGPGSEPDPKGLMAGPQTRLHVVSLTVENRGNGVEANGPFVSLEGCVLRANEHGLDTLAWEGTEVRDCDFIGSTDVGIIVFQGLGATNVLIEDCQFLAGVGGVDLQSDGGLVTGCTFDGTTVGLQLSFGAEAVINDCAFRNNLNVGMGLVGASTGTVTNSTFESSAINMIVANGSHLSGTGNTLSGGSLATLRLYLTTTVGFRSSSRAARHRW
jgi:hypothetical protein